LANGVEEAAVVIEGLDDVELQVGGASVDLDQLKHHLTKAANLTDASPDLWRTLRVWSTTLSNGGWNPDSTKLNLVTTATAPEGSAAWHLKAGAQRNIVRGRELLLKAIQESNADSKSVLHKAFSAFERLSEVDQKKLLTAVTIVDASPNIA